jgi:hypothetical protein
MLNHEISDMDRNNALDFVDFVRITIFQNHHTFTYPLQLWRVMVLLKKRCFSHFRQRHIFSLVLTLNTTPFLNRQFRLNRLWFGPWYRNRGCATFKLRIEVDFVHLILIKNGSAALSLLKKACNSI